MHALRSQCRPPPSTAAGAGAGTCCFCFRRHLHHPSCSSCLPLLNSSSRHMVRLKALCLNPTSAGLSPAGQITAVGDPPPGPHWQPMVVSVLPVCPWLRCDYCCCCCCFHWVILLLLLLTLLTFSNCLLNWCNICCISMAIPYFRCCVWMLLSGQTTAVAPPPRPILANCINCLSCFCTL